MGIKPTDYLTMQARLDKGKRKGVNDAVQLNEYENNRKSQSPVVEPLVRNESLAEEAREGTDSNRVCVSIKSFRRKLLDPDNLCPKYFIDCLRYSGAIMDDSAKDIILQVSQSKVKTKQEERTEITIEPL